LKLIALRPKLLATRAIADAAAARVPEQNKF